MDVSATGTRSHYDHHHAEEAIRGTRIRGSDNQCHESPTRHASYSRSNINSTKPKQRSEGFVADSRAVNQSVDAVIGGPLSGGRPEYENHPDSRPPVNDGIDTVSEMQAYGSPSPPGETWTAQDMNALADTVPMDIGVLPDQIISPSVSSGYYIEDGIFEPGSAYQNLFQSLRSHIFRTAQYENDAPTQGSTAAPGTSNASEIRSTEVRAGVTCRDDTASARTFELPPAQEYLLWKAWTEEVCIWVRTP